MKTSESSGAGAPAANSDVTGDSHSAAEARQLPEVINQREAAKAAEAAKPKEKQVHVSVTSASVECKYAARTYVPDGAILFSSCQLFALKLLI